MNKNIKRMQRKAKQMNIAIKKINGEVIFSGDFGSIKDCVQAAFKHGKSLESADLRYADLCYANLRYADLCSADLRSANLRYADLCSADLRYADLRYADLCYANLRSANLCYADLCSAKNHELAVAMTRILPEGDLIGWKKCQDNVLVKLLVPSKAKRSHAFGRKCRASYVKVLKVIGGKAGKSLNTSFPPLQYKEGATVKCGKWCDDFTEECAGGIHFFITRAEAEAFTL